MLVYQNLQHPLGTFKIPNRALEPHLAAIDFGQWFGWIVFEFNYFEIRKQIEVKLIIILS